MPSAGGPPASFLDPTCAWMDDRVAFEVPPGDPGLESACIAVWELSRALREARGRRGLSLSKLAISAGVRRQTVADIEAGKTWPDVATIARLCAKLGLDFGARQPDGG